MPTIIKITDSNCENDLKIETKIGLKIQETKKTIKIVHQGFRNAEAIIETNPTIPPIIFIVPFLKKKIPIGNIFFNAIDS